MIKERKGESWRKDMKRGNTFWREERGDLKTGVLGRPGEMIRERIRNDA